MTMAADEWVWLRHPVTEGVQFVPPSAKDTWLGLGWEPTDPPAEPNPALVEYVPITAPAAPKKKAKSEVIEDKPETTEKEMMNDA
jgi:hypothetical protein